MSGIIHEIGAETSITIDTYRRRIIDLEVMYASALDGSDSKTIRIDREGDVIHLPLSALKAIVAWAEGGATQVNSSQSVNDYVCPTCKNDRVSKNETTCWKCGGKLHP